MSIGAAFGTAFKVGTYTVGKLNSIGGLEISADTIETTTLDATNNYRTFIQGLKDGGEVSLSGYLDPTDTNGQKALYTALDAGTVLSCGIVFPTALSCNWAFSAVVTAFNTGAELEDMVSFEGTLKVSGKPVLS
jgi:predicted secreted protein